MGAQGPPTDAETKVPIGWRQIQMIENRWLAELGAEDAATRKAAAGEIFRVGRAAAESASVTWWNDPELVQLVGVTRLVTVGVAVWPEHFARIRAANGSPRLAAVPTKQDAMEFELHFEGGVALDVLTSRVPEGDGAIAKFLARQGEGVQQVEYCCQDVDRATTILRERFGMKAVYEATRDGADGTRINFFLASGPDQKKVLIELYEPPKN